MKTASDYPITYPYAATSPPYSKAHPHRGNDRKMDAGTPVVIAGVTIGLSGNTGFSTAPHLHTQAGTDPACQKTVNPAPYEFKTGRVVNLGTGPTWGKFVTLQVGTHYITYAHLSVIQAKLGQVIKGVPMEEKVSNKLYYELKRLYHGEAPSRAQLDRYVGKITEAELRRKLKASPKFKERIKQAEAGKLDPRDFLPIEIRQVYKDTRIQQFKDKITNLIKKA